MKTILLLLTILLSTISYSAVVVDKPVDKTSPSWTKLTSQQTTFNIDFDSAGYFTNTLPTGIIYFSPTLTNGGLVTFKLRNPYFAGVNHPSFTKFQVTVEPRNSSRTNGLRTFEIKNSNGQFKTLHETKNGSSFGYIAPTITTWDSSSAFGYVLYKNYWFDTDSTDGEYYYITFTQHYQSLYWDLGKRHPQLQPIKRGRTILYYIDQYDAMIIPEYIFKFNGVE